MDIVPDEYSIRDKFLGRLPEAICTRVFADKLSVEYNTLEELLEGTLDAEHVIRSERRFSKSAQRNPKGNENPEFKRI